jgi:cyclic dehypoxanthinyl futalosine synthase
LNTLPVLYGLRHGIGEGRFELLEAEPSACSKMLRAGEADLGLVPVATLATDGPWQVVPGVAIGADGQVGSVYLVGSEPMESWRTVLLDEASRSSAMLARLLLQARTPGGAHLPTEFAPGAEVEARVGGSVGGLLIGDRALGAADRYEHAYDLGTAWWDLAGLPFIFAVWAGRPGAIDEEGVALLQESLRFGLDDRDRIARAWAAEHDQEPETMVRYLERCIRYDLGATEQRGLRDFLRRCAQAELLPKTGLRFYPAVEGRDGQVSHESERVFETERRFKTSESLDNLLSKGAQGDRLSPEQALRLETEAPPDELLLAADLRRRALHPEGLVTYIVSRNINYTNVCTTACKFCAFYRPRSHREAYVLSREEMAAKIQETLDVGGIEILLQGGLHPDLDIAWYEDLFRWVKANFQINLHALSPEEIWHIAKVSNLGLTETLERLAAAGLDSIPGGGAEILDDEVRRRIAPLKATTDQWLEVMRAAHRQGLVSTATMMFGVGESGEQRVRHLMRLRDLQDESSGFTAFICWPFQSSNTRLVPGDTSAVAYLRTNALARLVLDNLPNLQASWVTMGAGVAQAALHGGANDFGQVMLEENVVSAAGTTHRMTAPGIERHIREAGFRVARRDVHYRRLPPLTEEVYAEPHARGALRDKWMATP